MRVLVQRDVRLALSALIAATLFVGCGGGSGSPVSPSGPSVSSVSNAFQHSGPAATKLRPDTACPAGGIVFAPGDNGTYSVAVGDQCVLWGPFNQPCNASQDGFTYLFYIVSGGSSGTLSGTTQGSKGSKATFERDSTGPVVIGLQAIEYQFFRNCRISGFQYGTVKLTSN